MLEKSYSLDDLAEAKSVSTLTIRREIARGRLTAERIGNQLRVTESEWDRYCADRTVGAGQSSQGRPVTELLADALEILRVHAPDVLADQSMTVQQRRPASARKGGR